MRLAAGNRLGPYEILSALGSGGMGEVYRARDTTLGRDVAIKVLGDAITNNPQEAPLVGNLRLRSPSRRSAKHCGVFWQ